MIRGYSRYPSATCSFKLSPVGSPFPFAPPLTQIKAVCSYFMSVSHATYQCINSGDPLRLSTLHNIQPASSKFSMFGSLKKKLSKRSPNPLNDPTWADANTRSTSPTAPKPAGSRSGGLAPPQDNNPFSSSSPATRRPSKCNTVFPLRW